MSKVKLCKHCNKEFLNKWNTTFCSHYCANKYNHLQKPRKYPISQYYCKVCGKMKRSPLNTYCSHTCENIAKDRIYKQKIDTDTITNLGHRTIKRILIK